MEVLVVGGDTAFRDTIKSIKGIRVSCEATTLDEAPGAYG